MSCETYEWCGGGHRHNLGQHRSDPQTWAGPSHTVVATRVRTGAGVDQMEVRLVVDLPRDPQRAEDLARVLVLGLDLTVRALLVGRLGRIKAAYRRVTGVRVQ